MCSGERAEFMPANPWGEEDNFWRGDELCAKPLDDENVIFFDYQNRGYRTLIFDDWATGVFQVSC